MEIIISRIKKLISQRLIENNIDITKIDITWIDKQTAKYLTIIEKSFSLSMNDNTMWKSSEFNLLEEMILADGFDYN